MAKRTCSIGGCERPFYGRGYCGVHYRQARKSGEIANRTPEERFWEKIDKSGACWLWTASVDTHGYGQFGVDRKTVLAHRYSYQLAFGDPIPREIDHVCHNRRCVNPGHLRSVTRKQNIENISGARSDSKSGIRGVWLVKGRWRAQVNHDGRRYHIGYFTSIEDAEKAVIAARIKLFTHNEIDRVA